jgi:hypothetical protein
MKDEGESLPEERRDGRYQVLDAEGPYGCFCPFLQNETDICLAAIFPMATGYKAKFDYCDNEDYDSCPLFLAKILREM